MTVLGILSCQILELEIASLVAQDRELTRITVIDDRRAQHLIEAIEAKGMHSVYRIPHISAFVPECSGDEVLIRVLELGLHRSRENLRATLEKESRAMDHYIDSLLLGYGQCGGALAAPEKVLDVGCPLFYPGKQECSVADCVALSLGADEEYYMEQLKEAGTYFLTPGWCHHWQEMLGPQDDCGNPRRSSQLCRRMLRGYSRLLVVCTPVMELDDMRIEARELAELAGLRIEEREGDLRLLEQSYRQAKQGMASPGQFNSSLADREK